MMTSLPALPAATRQGNAAKPRQRRAKQRRSGARSLELGRWEARNGVELPPRAGSVMEGNRANVIAHFSQTARGGQLLEEVDFGLPVSQLQRNGYILSGLTRSENDEATSKLNLLREIRVGAARDVGTTATVALSPKQRAAMHNIDPSQFEDLLVALKTGVSPAEAAAAAELARVAEDAKKNTVVAHTDSAKMQDSAELAEESSDARRAKHRPRPVKHRVEEKVSQFREHPMMMENLEKNVNRYREEERARAVTKKEEEAKRNARKRPQGPMAGEIHAAVQQAKAEMVRERRERAAAQRDTRALSLRDRRKLKKAEEEAARKREFNAERARGLMIAAALTSRLTFWAALVEDRRERIANDTQKEQRGAVSTIESYYLAYRFRSMMKREREKLAAAARVLQRNYRIHYGQIRMLKRKAAAGRVAEFMRAARRTGMIKVALKKFRMACVLIQRYWKAKYFKKTAEVALLCKYWDRQKDRHKHNIEQEIAKAKDLSTKAIAKAGKSKGPDYKKLAQKQKEKVDSIPKFQLKQAVPVEIKRQVLARWLSTEKSNHRTKMQLYYAAKRRYDAECARLASVIQARRAMGAAPPKELGREPRMPRLRLLPLFAKNYVTIIRDGEKAVEREMRKELARKRKAKEEAEKRRQMEEAGLSSAGTEEEDDAEDAHDS